MKLTEEALKILIIEVLNENPNAGGENADDTGLDSKVKTGVMSTQQRVKQSRERIKAAGQELDSKEKQIIDQLETKITQLASLPGVDLSQYRPLLVRILKILMGSIKPKETK